MTTTSRSESDVELPDLDPWLGRALDVQKNVCLALAIPGLALLSLSVYVLLFALPESANGTTWFLLVLVSWWLVSYGLARIWAMGGLRRGRWAGADLTLWKVREASHDEDWDGFTTWFSLVLDDLDPARVSAPPPGIRRPTQPTSRSVDVRMSPSSPSGDSLWAEKVVVLAQARDGAMIIAPFPTGRLYRCSKSPWTSLAQLFHL